MSKISLFGTIFMRMMRIKEDGGGPGDMVEKWREGVGVG